MARPLRISYPGAVYHVTSRGNRKNAIFLNDQDRQVFLTSLSSIIKHHHWICHAYCLMSNHYHLLIETNEANISDGMRDLNKEYSQAFNRLHGTVGHLLQGRFKSFIIEKEPYLLEVARYTVLNPVRAGLVKKPSDWLWSSYLATAGLRPSPLFLNTDWILQQFSDEQEVAQLAYVAFVKDGMKMGSPFEQAAHRSIVGSPQFVYEMWEQAKDSMKMKDIPREERIIGRLSLEEMFPPDMSRKERDDAIVFARVGCGYSVAQIARFLKLSQSLISKISKQI